MDIDVDAITLDRSIARVKLFFVIRSVRQRHAMESCDLRFTVPVTILQNSGSFVHFWPVLPNVQCVGKALHANVYAQSFQNEKITSGKSIHFCACLLIVSVRTLPPTVTSVNQLI